MTLNNIEKRRVWFITGASKGLGYAFTRAALESGDKVVAVARTNGKLDELKNKYQDMLLPLKMDVTAAPLKKVFLHRKGMEFPKTATAGIHFLKSSMKKWTLRSSKKKIMQQMINMFHNG